MLVKTFSAAMMGLEATTITIEVNLTRGAMFHLSGLADTAVKESYDRIRAAIENIGFKPPQPTSPSTSRQRTSVRKAAATICLWPSASSRLTVR